MAPSSYDKIFFIYQLRAKRITALAAIQKIGFLGSSRGGGNPKLCQSIFLLIVNSEQKKISALAWAVP